MVGLVLASNLALGPQSTRGRRWGRLALPELTLARPAGGLDDD